MGGKPEYVKCPDFPKLMKFDIVQFFHNEKAYGEHGIITKTGVVDPTDWKKQASSEVLFFGPGEFGGSSARLSICPNFRLRKEGWKPRTHEQNELFQLRQDVVDELLVKSPEEQKQLLVAIANNLEDYTNQMSRLS